MKANIRKRGDTALSELAKTYELVRDELADRLDGLAGRIDELDTKALGGRAYSSAAAVRDRAEKRAQQLQKMRPGRRRRPMPWGWLVLGVLTLGVAWVMYDQRRRDMIRGQVTQLTSRTGSMPGASGVAGAVDGVMGRMRGSSASMLDEERLRSEVETAIAGAGEGGLPDGLQVAVEGRTVYLRGSVDSALADSAASRAQSVEGVAAVVNLTTPPRPASGRSTVRKAGNG
jgi:BON domain